jgi:hypothetical protein
LTSYHSSIVKVLVPRAVFYLLLPSLSRAFQEIKPPMFSSNFWSTSASLDGVPVGPASRTVQLLWICFAAHLSTTAYFTTFHSSVKGFENFFLMSFSSHLQRVLMSYMGWEALGI